MSYRWAWVVVGLLTLMVPAALGTVLLRDWSDQAVVVQDLLPSMVIVPKGRLVGENASEHTDEIAAFAIAQTEVTQAQWTAVMGSNPSYFQGDRGGGDDHPVEQVNYFDALVYLNRLTEWASQAWGVKLTPCYVLTVAKGTPGTEDFTVTKVERKQGCTGYRLPTEWEWEYAARVMTDTTIYTGNVEIWGQNNAPAVGVIGWYRGNSGVEHGGHDCTGSLWELKEQEFERCGTHDVAKKPANLWMLHDMIGNVYEWTDSPYEGALDADTGLGDFVVRGCGWFSYARACRASRRGFWLPGGRNIDLGFRPARSSLDSVP